MFPSLPNLSGVLEGALPDLSKKPKIVQDAIHEYEKAGRKAERQLKKDAEIPSFKLPSLQSTVTIIIGLLLIAAGIFSLKDVREAITEGGKVAAL